MCLWVHFMALLRGGYAIRMETRHLNTSHPQWEASAGQDTGRQSLPLSEQRRGLHPALELLGPGPLLPTPLYGPNPLSLNLASTIILSFLRTSQDVEMS